MRFRPQLFTFDLIGTLFDAKSVYVRAFAEACKIHDLNLKNQDGKIRKTIGNKRLSEIVAEIFPGMSAEKFSDFQTSCNEIRDAKLLTDCRPFPGALKAVAYLRSVGHDTALITVTSKSGMLHLINRFDLHKLFKAENIFCRDLQDNQILTNIELKEIQLMLLQNRNEDSLISMIGDSLSDLEAAYTHCFEFWGFLRDNPDKEAFLQRIGPDRLFSSYNQFISRLKWYEENIRPHSKI